MKGNKGEWSELYVFLRLLSQGRVYAANEQLKKDGSICYPILKIMRKDSDGLPLDYVVRENEIEVRTDSSLLISVPRELFGSNADILLSRMQNGRGTFECREVADFANGIRVTSLKAPSNKKTDISTQISDIHTGYIQDVGFSIKSYIGNKPTLLNAGKTTNFIYEVSGLGSDQIDDINAIEGKKKIIDRMEAIRHCGGRLSYCGMSNATFHRNLVMIDSLLPEIIGNMILYFYTLNEKDCVRLVDLLGEYDPLGFDDRTLYEYKIKKFLSSCALGMRPSTKWDGIDEANGGYLVVKKDGEILAYYIYNRNAFESYLLSSTSLVRSSTSRYDYLHLYESNGSIYINLNLQVRFK